MVKIVEVDEHSDAEGDEECVEIDPAEFAKKVNLKETDDVVLVAATCKIKLVEVVDPEKDFAKTGSRTRESGAATQTQDIRPELAAGDSMDDPCEIDEGESVPMQMEIVKDRFAVVDKPPSEFGADGNSSSNGKCIQGYNDERRTAAIPYKIVVKAEPYDLDGVDGFVGHDAYSPYNKMNSEPGEEDAVGVCGKLGAKPSEVADNPVAKCDPVDGDSGVKGAEEDGYGHCLETVPKPRTSDDEEEDGGFVIV